MEDVIQKLEEKRGYDLEQLREIEDQIKRLDKVLADLRTKLEAIVPSIPDDPATRPARIFARTPWP